MYENDGNLWETNVNVSNQLMYTTITVLYSKNWHVMYVREQRAYTMGTNSTVWL